MARQRVAKAGRLKCPRANGHSARSHCSKAFTNTEANACKRRPVLSPLIKLTKANAFPTLPKGVILVGLWVYT